MARTLQDVMLKKQQREKMFNLELQLVNEDNTDYADQKNNHYQKIIEEIKINYSQYNLSTEMRALLNLVTHYMDENGIAIRQSQKELKSFQQNFNKLRKFAIGANNNKLTK